MGESKSLNAFSPDGRIYQIEYAMTAMTLGTTCIGYKGNGYTILVSEKKILNKLQVPSSINKHIKISDNILMGFSGVSSDTRAITKKARDFCLNYLFKYNKNPSVFVLAQHLCDLALNFSERKWENKIFGRPFGVNLLLAGDSLVSVDPSGSYREYKAKSIGSDIEIKVGDYDRDQAIRYLLFILSKNMRDKINSENVEVGYVDSNGVRELKPIEIQEYLNQIDFKNS